MRLCIFLLTFFTASCLAAVPRLLVVTEEWRPYNYLNDGNVIVGDATLAVKDLLTKAGLEYDIRLYPWARSYQLAETTPNVAIYSMYRTEERVNKFIWFCPIIKPVAMHFYKLKHRTDLENINDINQLRETVIGVNRNDWIHHHLKEKGFVDGVQIDPASQMDTNLQKLFAGRIDLIVNSKAGMKAELYKANKTLDAVSPVYTLSVSQGTDLCLALNPDSDAAVIEAVSRAFDSLAN